jgi:hypothetical protein
LVDNLNGYVPNPDKGLTGCEFIKSFFKDAPPEPIKFTICPLDPESILTWFMIREKVSYGCSMKLCPTLERINRRAPAMIKYYQTIIVVFILILAYNMYWFYVAGDDFKISPLTLMSFWFVLIGIVALVKALLAIMEDQLLSESQLAKIKGLRDGYKILAFKSSDNKFIQKAAA